MNDIIIAYISPDIESQMREKIAERLRIRQIRTTTDVNKATLVISCLQQIQEPSLTLSELAESLIQQTAQEIVELKDLMYQDISHKTQKIKHQKHVYVLKQYKQIQQRQKRIFFNRTKYK